MIPRYKLYDLCVRTYDAEDSNYTDYVDIISSEYDPETKKFGQLGTVFSIRAMGYGKYVYGASVRECVDIRYDGASRVCFFPTNTGNSHPQQVEALVAFQSNTRAMIYPGHYLTEDSVAPMPTGLLMTSCGSTRPDRFYLTTVYGLYGDNNLSVYVSTDPTFEGEWIELFCGVDDYDTSYNANWVMAYVTAVPYTGQKSFKGRVSVNEMTGTVDTVQKLKGRVSAKKFTGTVL